MGCRITRPQGLKQSEEGSSKDPVINFLTVNILIGITKMSVLQRIPAPVSAGITVHLFLAEAAMTGWIYKGYHRPVVPPLHSFPLLHSEHVRYLQLSALANLATLDRSICLGSKTSPRSLNT